MLPILVTAISSYGLQILKALNLVKKDRYYLIGGDNNRSCLYTKLVDEYVKLPLANDIDYIETLLSVCKKYDIKALFCGCEPELKVLSSNRQVFINNGIFLPINSERVLDICMNKKKTNEYLLNHGFSVPRIICNFSECGIETVECFPVIVKPSTNSGGSSNVYIAQNQRELLALYNYLVGFKNSEDFLVQEYVGSPENEYTVSVLSDMDGNYINSIAMNRMLSTKLHISSSVENRTPRKELGQKLIISSGISQGCIGQFSNVTNQCKEISSVLGSVGALNIQCRLVDNIVKVFEINPRFSGTTYMRAMVGYNEPDVLIRKHIFGEDIETNFHYNSCVVVRDIVERII